MKQFILFLISILPLSISGQNLSGKVLNDEGYLLIGASVYWAETTLGTTTDQKGRFEIALPDGNIRHLLVASYIGHDSDTIDIRGQASVEFLLNKSILEEIVISEKKDGVIISDVDPIKTEQLTSTELAKAPCCDLAGCFNTQTTVQSQTTNIITNSKELRILGLPGVYTQILADGFPMFQGLSYTYGISSIPGTSVETIFVSKGANSVLQGYESISGQINVITKKPEDTDKLLLNAYINSFAIKQFNANYSTRKGKWNNFTSFHTSQPANEFDRDEDSFIDVPKLTRYTFSNKLKYGNAQELGLNSTIGFTYLNEERVGGQAGFDPDKDAGSSEVYGQMVDISQPQLWVRTGYRLSGQHNFVLHTSSFYQEQNSYFGNVKYDAEQINFYANLQHEFSYGESGNGLKSGISLRSLDLDEDISFTGNAIGRTYAGNYVRDEKVIGAFAENTLELLDNTLTWIVGIRADNHNQFGTIVTPRTLVKYNLTPSTTVRANIGTGWRTVNLFSENVGLLVSSRDIVFAEDLEPEKGLNTGINITQKLRSEKTEGFFTVDFYRTDFQNQIFPDYFSEPNKAIINNFDGKSVSNVFQAELSLSIGERMYMKSGYSFLDVHREINGEKQDLPFNAKHKFLATLGYRPLSYKWNLDLNAHAFGKQRLANTDGNPVEYQRGDFSEPYAVLNGQFTYTMDKAENSNRLEWYFGCDNIFDFRQKQPIVAWQEPFSPYFDTSSVWGPTQGREFYLGVRFIIEGE